MKRTRWGLLLVIALVPMSTATGVSWGQSEPMQVAPPLPEGVHDRPPRGWRPRSETGNAVLVGGGVGNFRQDDERVRTGVGGSWNVRLVSGTRIPVAVEVAYVGGVNDVNGPGIGPDDYLLSNGVEGLFRLNVPLAWRDLLLAPFAGIGFGWNRLTLVNAGDDLNIRTSDNQMLVPMAGGLSFGYRGFLADARFTYRHALNDQMFGDADMSHWAVALNLGAEF